MIPRLKDLAHRHPLLLLIFLFAATRLLFLSLLPVFSDEALYMEWGWRATHYPGQLFHSLLDAKQPFLMWFFGLGQILFPDPLFGARLTSVTTGLLSLIGLWKIGTRYFNPQIAFLSSLLYCLIPSFLFFDRQALMESGLVAASLWSLYFLLALHSHPSFKHAVFLGLALGLGFFNKNSAGLFLLGFLGIQVIFSFRQNFPAVKQASLTFFTLISFLLVNLPLFFQPLYWSTLNTNTRWTFTLSEMLRFPLIQWFTNFIGNLELAFVHFTPPAFILLFVGFILLLRTRKPQHLAIILWFALPLIPFLLSQKFMNFMIWRYQTPLLAVTPLIIAFALAKLNKYLISLCLILPAILSLILIFDPIAFFRLQSKITRYSYIDGYVTGYDTGYQVNAIVNWLRAQSVKQPIYVGIGVHSFNPESGIWAYFRKSKSVTVSYFDSRLFPPGALNLVDCLAANRPFYFVAKLNDTVGLDKYLDRVTVITNSYNPDYATIYTLKKDCQGSAINLDLSAPITH